jgi:hypothetical protein
MNLASVHGSGIALPLQGVQTERSTERHRCIVGFPSVSKSIPGLSPVEEILTRTQTEKVDEDL